MKIIYFDKIRLLTLVYFLISNAQSDILLFTFSSSKLDKMTLIFLKKLGLLCLRSTCIEKDLLVEYATSNDYHLNGYYSFKKASNLEDRIQVLSENFFGPGNSSLSKLAVGSTQKYISYNFANEGLNTLDYIRFHSGKYKGNIQITYCSKWSSILNNLGIKNFPSASNINLLVPFSSVGNVFFCITRVLKTFTRVLIELSKTENNDKLSGDVKKYFSKPSICISGVWGIDESRKNDFWMLGEHKNLPKRAYYFFDRLDYKATSERIAYARNKGLVPVALSKRYVEKEVQEEIFYPNINKVELILSLLVLVFQCYRLIFKDRIDRLICCELIWVAIRANHLSSVFKSFNTAVVFSIQEASHDEFSLACEYSNAVRMATHWSVVTGPTYVTTITPHVYFYWSRLFSMIGEKSAILSKNVLLSGSLFLSLSNTIDRKKTHHAVKKLQSNGAKFTITMFDTSASSEKFFQYMCQYVLSNPDVGLLIKSKGRLDSNKFKKKKSEKCFEQANNTGRLVFLNKLVSPYDAVDGVDIAVGVGSPSALILAAMSSAKVLFLDLCSTSHEELRDSSPIYDETKVKCVVHSYKELGELLNLVKNGDEIIGDISSVINRYDEFMDGDATKRISFYLEKYLENFDNTKNRNIALNFASIQYSALCGGDKVILTP